MTTTDFVFNTPLYQKITENTTELLSDLSTSYNEYSSHNVIFDGYNSLQGKESTFGVKSALATRLSIGSSSYKENFFQRSALWLGSIKCLRYGDIIELCLWIDADDRSIMKVGQYPSVADIHIGQIKQYKSILPKEDLKEFTRAIGLAANGVGIGSFVYMRRIFENLIWAAAKEAADVHTLNADDFGRMKMNEKIDVLKAFLPDTLVELKDMYGILSKGLHELSESECLACFDVMRTGIELILDDKLEQKRKEEKKKNAVEAMVKLKAALKKDESNNK